MNNEWIREKFEKFSTRKASIGLMDFKQFEAAVAEILEGERKNRESVEDGWLIEKGRLCLGLACGIGAWVTFTDPAAIRFARKIDAENMLRGLRSLGKDNAFSECVVTGHSWIGPLADQRDTQRESGGSNG